MARYTGPVCRICRRESMKLFQELGQKRGMARLLDCLACSAALQSQPEHALRLAGAAAAMRQVLGAPLPLADQARLEKTLESARQSVSPTIAAAAWMDGWTTPADKTIRDALAYGLAEVYTVHTAATGREGSGNVAFRRDVFTRVGRFDPGFVTAEDVDFTRQIRHALPYVLAFVLVLAFGLLLVAFRSLVVPLKAIALNLLSVAASYGVLALVFQHHWAEPILGFKSNGTIVSWLPLFLFVVLFGLSMDYHVFIISRIRETFDRGATMDDAVSHGIKASAGVVTSAALVTTPAVTVMPWRTASSVHSASPPKNFTFDRPSCSIWRSIGPACTSMPP